VTHSGLHWRQLNPWKAGSGRKSLLRVRLRAALKRIPELAVSEIAAAPSWKAFAVLGGLRCYSGKPSQALADCSAIARGLRRPWRIALRLREGFAGLGGIKSYLPTPSMVCRNRRAIRQGLLRPAAIAESSANTLQGLAQLQSRRPTPRKPCRDRIAAIQRSARSSWRRPMERLGCASS